MSEPMRPTPRNAFVLIAVWLTVGPTMGRATAQSPKIDPAQAEFFEAKVRPILVEKCLSCHGETKPKGKLKLTSRSMILAGGSTGPAAVAGKPEESLIVEAVRYRDEPKMPPKQKLADAEIAVIEKWVTLGLPWPETKAEASAPTPSATDSGPVFSEEQRKFWSFQPIRDAKPPTVKDASWPKSEIDRFILAPLEAKGLKPAAPADKRTLIRRASIDLTGLPPTPEEVEAFLRDPKDDAFARLVDRLLASPAYGERWSRFWLDVVRYADALDSRGAGGVGDILDAWRYRDWVVDALNNDMPYDEFARNQIAGDVLPSPNPVEKKDGFNRAGTIATTMLAIGNWGNGDADKDKILTDIADDQVDVVSRTFLGLTMACARCHDHKFDPISQKDYYGMAGIFFSTHILPKLTPKGAGETIIRVPLVSTAEFAKREQRDARIAALDKQIRDTAAAKYAALSKDLQAQGAKYVLAAWEFSRRPESERTPQALAQFASKKGLLAFPIRNWVELLGLSDRRPLNRKAENNGGAGVSSWLADDPTGLPSVTANTRAEATTVATFTLPAHSISVHPGPASGVVIAWKSPIAGRVRVSGKLADGDPGAGDGVSWTIGHRSAQGPRELATGDIVNSGNQPFAAGGNALGAIDVSIGDTIQLVILPKAEYTCDTTSVDFEVSTLDGSKTWNLAKDVVGNFLSANPHSDQYGNVAVWRFEDLQGNFRPLAINTPGNASIGTLFREMGSGDGKAIESAAARFAAEFRPKPGDDPFLIRNPGDEPALPAKDLEVLAKLRSEIEALRREHAPPVEFANAAAEGGVPESPHAGTHDVRVHMRGRYDRLGDLVPRRFPVILAGGAEKQPKITAGSGRKELAEWLTRPDNPLTARVIVNRIWQHHFAEGIVRTPSNFGKLGERPTHPELLDHLAKGFVQDCWSLKRLHRRIMLSAAYRQSSVPDPKTFEADPDNRLFGWMNRQRFDAEVLRDSLLAVSGRLDPTRSGPPVRDLNGTRRSLYVMSIRSDRSSFMTLFDQADSTAPADKRINSTVAPQALFLLNNGFVFEQAKALATRLASEVPADEAKRIARAYELLYSRPPEPGETAIALAAIKSAREAGDTSEAAWTSLCQILLCANEFVYVD